jgi:hypothetical protein
MSLRDCVRMSEIAAEMMSQAKIDDARSTSPCSIWPRC